jgi:hypothetical protein
VHRDLKLATWLPEKVLYFLKIFLLHEYGFLTKCLKEPRKVCKMKHAHR